MSEITSNENLEWDEEEKGLFNWFWILLDYIFWKPVNYVVALYN
jgi:hypothetical protein